VAGQRPQGPSAAGVPEVDVLVGARGGHEPAVGGERDGEGVLRPVRQPAGSSRSRTSQIDAAVEAGE
jgi:hypothetical protein